MTGQHTHVVCPSCGRGFDPAVDACPRCGADESAQARSRLKAIVHDAIESAYLFDGADPELVLRGRRALDALEILT